MPIGAPARSTITTHPHDQSADRSRTACMLQDSDAQLDAADHHGAHPV